MVSYRDPHLKNTLKVYENLPEYLKTFQADELEMTKYIIGTVSELDTPMNASAKGALALNAYFSGLTGEDFQKEREEILDADVAAIQNLAALAEALISEHNLCVVGSEAAIGKDSDVFRSTEALIQA